ncbi:Sodium channel protein type 11 subunit alpha [Symbiodinium microadriaticum]|uniref:Sodium channel protein type 11 subunit alpha n=1 Tax=Symbiodinium microadriaticum TaxID=2951 RepID=A0A1Q9CWY6_SYMMI|nr:Sodium channel protein type 11 subunit alpha [Symbiodinium microadriaticum]
MQLVGHALQRGFTVMVSDFSLKALLSEWSEELLGANPFVKLPSSCDHQFQLDFFPEHLKNDEVPQQLQVVGELCAADGRAVVSAMSDTIVYTINPKRPQTDAYQLRVLTVVGSWSGGGSVPEAMKCEIEHNGSSKRGVAGHVTLTYPSGGQLVTSMGHWIELTRINTSVESLMQVAAHNFGEEEVYQHSYDLGYPRFTLPASEEWPLADLGFFMLDWVFGVIYFLEIIIKIFGLKCGFIKDPWNWFDSSLVMFWLVEKTLSAYAQLDQGLLRVLRMGRVLRLLRLVKTIQGFDALYIMTTAMQGSVTVLFWSFVLLMVVQTLIAFTLNQALDSYFKDKTKPVNEQHQVFEYFGTAGRAMFTMFELTLANWPTAARILQENVTEYYGIFSVAYKLIIGFAAVGIINAVFMQETFKVAASDDKLMMRQKDRDRMLHTKKMRTLFAAADESGDGVLDQDEFREIMNNPDIRMWLAAQELPVRDPDVLWRLLDDGDAELTADELVAGVDRLKGTAKGIDLAAFMMETREFQIKICEKLGIEMEKEEEEEDDDD